MMKVVVTRRMQMSRRIRVKPKSASRERNSWRYFATLKAQRIKWQRLKGVWQFTKAWKISSLHSYRLKKKKKASTLPTTLNKLYIYIYVLVVGLSVYFWQCWVIVAAGLFSLVAVGRSYSLAGVHWLSLWGLLLLQRMHPRAQGQQLRLMGLVAPRRVVSSRIMD